MTNIFPTNLILFDDDNWGHLLPLTLTRPISEIRVGILTIKEKWQKHLNVTASYITQDYLSSKYPIHIEDDNILINSTILPSQTLIKYVKQLRLNEALVLGEEMIAARLSNKQLNNLGDSEETFKTLKKIDLENQSSLTIDRILRTHYIFQLNAQELIKDFELITKGLISQEVSKTNNVFGKYPIFLEQGVSMECCNINTNEGPVYIGAHAIIMEGCNIRGGLSVGERAVIKMGSKIYGATTIGPHCRVGGEVNNSVLFGYSNKGHDGFLGNSIIGEWCNLGADTNTSNLKNNYQTVKTWSYVDQKFTDTGLQFCGIVMGDHSKCGINTMFNTGTTVGVACNIFGDGFPRTYIPSFSWGGAAEFVKHTFPKAIETAKAVLDRRSVTLSEEDIEILRYVESSGDVYKK